MGGEWDPERRHIGVSAKLRRTEIGDDSLVFMQYYQPLKGVT